ncbi:YlbF family regulator [Liberiplasma polymorphum]|uniref:YlbF family regulator n=1 Tax=Liberiplasma polymorphum TaxID=3374570 RepID=UPI0037752523
MNDKALQLTNNLIETLSKEESYQNLIALDQRISNSEELHALIYAFQEAKTKYEEAKQYGKYHPDLKRYTTNYQQAKQILFTHETIKAYKEAEKAFQAMLDDIAKDIASAVSTQVKYEHKYKFSHKGGGSCSTEKV